MAGKMFESRDINVIIYALKISFIVIHPASFVLFICVRKYGQGEINYVSNNSSIFNTGKYILSVFIIPIKL